MKRLSRQLLLVGIIGVACPLLYHTLMSQWSSYTLRAGPNSGHLSENVDTDFTVEDCPPRWEEKPEIPRELGSEIKGDKDAPTQWSKQQGAGGMLLQADTVRARGGNHKVQANADTLLGTAKLTTEETPRDQAGVMAQGKDINRSVHSPVHKGVPGDNATPVAPKLQGNSKLATVGTLGDRDGVAQERDASTRVRSPAPKGVVDNTTIHLAVVVCGERVEESLTMLKSATLFTRTFMSFHIFTEDGLRGNFTTQLSSWPEDVKNKFTYQLHPISFPGVTRPDIWIRFFKPCACQRILIPYLLPDVDKLLYVDTDVLFLSPLDDIWKFFGNFNSTHILALTPEHEAPWKGWYNMIAIRRHPFYGELGVNSGVMLMDLPRMRDSQWLPLMDKYFSIYRLNLTWGDQDLVNIFFHYFPEKLYIYPCEWNYRPDHCRSICKTAEQEGAHVVHGNRRVFHNDKEPIFNVLYHAIKDFVWGSDQVQNLVQVQETRYQEKEVKSSLCGKRSHAIIKGLNRTINGKPTRTVAEKTPQKMAENH